MKKTYLLIILIGLIVFSGCTKIKRIRYNNYIKRTQVVAENKASVLKNQEIKSKLETRKIKRKIYNPRKIKVVRKVRIYKKKTTVFKKKRKYHRKRYVKVTNYKRKHITKNKKVTRSVRKYRKKIYKKRISKVHKRKWHKNTHIVLKRSKKVLKKYSEPFSIKQKRKDPELLGPQTTIKRNPLVYNKRKSTHAKTL